MSVVVKPNILAIVKIVGHSRQVVERTCSGDGRMLPAGREGVRRRSAGRVRRRPDRDLDDLTGIAIELRPPRWCTDWPGLMGVAQTCRAATA